MPEPEEYLGDGVYARFDGFMIWLDLRAQDDTTKIALEPSVLNALNRFADHCYQEATEGLEA